MTRKRTINGEEVTIEFGDDARSITKDGITKSAKAFVGGILNYIEKKAPTSSGKETMLVSKEGSLIQA